MIPYEDLLRRIDVLERQQAEQETRLTVIERRREVDPEPARRYVSRDSSISRVLAGASRRLQGYGHRWIRDQLEAPALLGYSLALAGAVSCTDDVRRQVNRATFVMQCAAAAIEGVTVEKWVELHGKDPT